MSLADTSCRQPLGFSLHFGAKMKPRLQSCHRSGKTLSRFGKTLRRFRKTSPEVFLNLLKVFLNLPKVFLNLPKVFPNLWQDGNLAFSFGAVGEILGEISVGLGTLNLCCLVDAFEHSVELPLGCTVEACMWLKHSKYCARLTSVSF